MIIIMFLAKWLGMQCMPCMHGEYAPGSHYGKVELLS